MKLKTIVITSKVSPKVKKWINDYFATDPEKGIVQFNYTADEINLSLQNEKMLEEIQNANFHAIYEVESCDIDFVPFEITIHNRNQLYNYVMATYKLCPKCADMYDVNKRVLGIGMDGTVGHEVI